MTPLPCPPDRAPRRHPPAGRVLPAPFHTALPLALALACAATAPAAFAQAAPAPAQLAAAPERISDEAISRDQATYEAVQRRIERLNGAGRPLRDYVLAKAQCWLDTSFHEYTRNDRGAFPQAALAESEKLVAAMETRPPAEALALAQDTPRVNGAAQLRPDLWAAAAALKGAAGFACAQQKTACAEVELVHAGNEYDQQQWRHARPYVQIAEDLLGEAAALAARCAAPPAAPEAPKPAGR